MESLGINSTEVNPQPGLPAGERRRFARYKLQSPAYASVGRAPRALVLDLHEILDLSEEGVCFQSAAQLEPERVLDLCLEFSHGEGHIYTPGRVVWSSAHGRTGIYFPSLTPSARQQLRESLALDHAGASSNGASAPHDTNDADLVVSPGGAVEPYLAASTAVSPDYTTILAALDAVRREVARQGVELDGALQLIVHRALAFTGGSGAAIALGDNHAMTCRATAGSDAPGLGAPVNTGSGFSGHCIRSGQVMYCDDSETDSRVNRESCRVLGVRSIIAVPIHVDATVVGLLEVFSPHPAAFDVNANLVLQQLAETAAAVIKRAMQVPSENADAREGMGIETEPEVYSVELQTPWVYRGLLIGAATVVAATLLWLLVPWGSFRVRAEKGPDVASAKPVVPSPVPSSPIRDLNQVQALAQRGDPLEQFALGVRYATGDEVKQDYNEAAHWFSLAADQGHVGAQETLGAYYWAGRGVPQDLPKAYFWSVLAQAGGNEASKYRVAILASRMTHEQILAAQEQANEWLREHESSARPADPQ
jgi:hypothetical protein